MLYRLLKFPASLAFWFYCKRLRVSHPEYFNLKGPLLIAANHPNSFLDAIVLATLFKRPIYSLARGDAYSNNFISKILYSFKILPVYRLSEGAENLSHNYNTFEKCLGIFKKDGIVLIFSEGRCINEWHLRPLKKGTARLAQSAWESGIPLRILPTGINYSSFRKFGKNIDILFDAPFENEFLEERGSGKFLNTFNNKLEASLKELVYEIPEDDQQLLKKTFEANDKKFKKALLFFPAIIGFIVTAPLYFSAKMLTTKKWNNDHFDSIMVGILFLAFPFYVILLSIIIGITVHPFFGFAAFLYIPLCALALLHFKKDPAA